MKQWSENGRLVAHETTAVQVAQLLDLVDRDLEVATSVQNVDWSLGIGYNAVL
ncbi:MAG: hypothetical protein HY814_10360 [Candidatus Riflebacteria bacterium]|nr:hypothetical protein [Candidatus Riflebacteria bacterium]